MDGRRVLDGRYELGGLIGQGGMGSVHAGHDRRLDRPVAIKLMPAGSRSDAEARMAARLVHPHVVAVFDSGETEDGVFLVMELLPGDTLADRIHDGPMPEAEVDGLAREVLDAVGAAHAAGIVHRDIKPSNILATGSGHWKVGDFGVAKTTDRDADATTTAGLVVGTLSYLAPERIAGGRATAATDIYAVGVVLHEALTGRRPAPGSPAPPGVLGATISRATAPDPAARWSSASAMTAALDPDRTAVYAAAPPSDPTLLLPAAPPSDPTLLVPAAPPKPRLRRATALILLATAVVIGAALYIGAHLGGSGAAAPPPTTTTTTTTVPPTTTVAPTTLAPVPTPAPKKPAEHHPPHGPGGAGG